MVETNVIKIPLSWDNLRELARDTSVVEVIDDMQSWEDPNSRRFPERLNNSQSRDRRLLQQMLAESAQKGETGSEAAEKVDDFLTPISSPRRKAKVMPWSGKGSSAVRTLSRTEVTRAHGLATIEAARLNPFVDGVSWNLSAAHPKADACDGNSRGSSRGLPKGVYKTSEVPGYPEHPNCLCYLSPFVSRKTSTILRDLIRRERGPLRDIPFFIADDVEEAERLARVALGVDADYADDLHLANLTNRAMYETRDAGFDLPPTVRVFDFENPPDDFPWRTMDDTGTYAQLNLSNLSLEINKGSKFWWDEATAQNEWNSRWFSTPERIGVLKHELGHYNHIVQTDTDWLRKSVKWIPAEDNLDVITGQVSRYSNADMAEFVAETFAKKVSGGSVSDEVEALYRLMGGPVPGGQKDLGFFERIRLEGLINKRGDDLLDEAIEKRITRYEDLVIRAEREDIFNLPTDELEERLADLSQGVSEDRNLIASLQKKMQTVSDREEALELDRRINSIMNNIRRNEQEADTIDNILNNRAIPPPRFLEELPPARIPERELIRGPDAIEEMKEVERLWLPQLNAPQREAVEDWAGTAISHDLLQGWLRRGEVPTRHRGILIAEGRIVDSLDQTTEDAIEAYLRRWDENLYEAVEFSEVPRDMAAHRYIDFAKMPENHPLRNPNIGDVFREQGFMSTTLDRKWLEDHISFEGIQRRALRFEFEVPEGSRAAWVEEFSDVVNEQELLFPKNTEFEILGRRGDTIAGRIIPESTLDRKLLRAVPEDRSIPPPSRLRARPEIDWTIEDPSSIDDDLIRMRKTYVGELTPADDEVIHWYTAGGDFAEMLNRHYREKIPMRESLEYPHILPPLEEARRIDEHLFNLLERSYIDQESDVYRVAGRKWLDGDWRPGDVYMDEGYTSTTTFPWIMPQDNYKPRFRILLPEGSKAMHLETDWHEVLVQRGGKYLIDGVDRDENVWSLIHLPDRSNILPVEGFTPELLKATGAGRRRFFANQPRGRPFQGLSEDELIDAIRTTPRSDSFRVRDLERELRFRETEKFLDDLPVAPKGEVPILTPPEERILTREAKEFWDDLKVDDEEMWQANRRYIEGNMMPVNNIRRRTGGRVTPEDVARYDPEGGLINEEHLRDNALLDDFFHGVDVDDDITLFRGIKNTTGEPHPIWDGFEPGDEFIDWGFTSTSVDRSIFDNYITNQADRFLEIRVPKGTPGKYFKPIGVPTQKELVLGPGTRYKLVGRSPIDSPFPMITVDVVPEDELTRLARRQSSNPHLPDPPDLDDQKDMLLKAVGDLSEQDINERIPYWALKEIELGRQTTRHQLRDIAAADHAAVRDRIIKQREFWVTHPDQRRLTERYLHPNKFPRVYTDLDNLPPLVPPETEIKIPTLYRPRPLSDHVLNYLEDSRRIGNRKTLPTDDMKPALVEGRTLFTKRKYLARETETERAQRIALSGPQLRGGIDPRAALRTPPHVQARDAQKTMIEDFLAEFGIMRVDQRLLDKKPVTPKPKPKIILPGPTRPTEITKKPSFREALKEANREVKESGETFRVFQIYDRIEKAEERLTTRRPVEEIIIGRGQIERAVKDLEIHDPTFREVGKALIDQITPGETMNMYELYRRWEKAKIAARVPRPTPVQIGGKEFLKLSDGTIIYRPPKSVQGAFIAPRKGTVVRPPAKPVIIPSKDTPTRDPYRGFIGAHFLRARPSGTVLREILEGNTPPEMNTRFRQLTTSDLIQNFEDEFGLDVPTLIREFPAYPYGRELNEARNIADSMPINHDISFDWPTDQDLYRQVYNEMNNAIVDQVLRGERVPSRFMVMPREELIDMHGFPVARKTDAIATYISADNKPLAIGLNTAPDLRRLWLDDSLMRGMYNDRYTAFPDRTGAILHETGHWIHNEFDPDLYTQTKDWPDWDTIAEDLDIASRVGRYAASNAGEFVAEMYSGRRSGKMGLWDDDLEELYRLLGGP